MIAFQIEGFINLFYIIFCLWHLSKAVNFVFQKNWTFPLYLKLLLKYIVIIELLTQLGLQVPVPYLHPENFKVRDDTVEDEEEILLDPKWMRVIGFISFWRVNPLTKVPENTDISNIVLKCLMYSFIIAQENIFLSEEYGLFTKKTLSNIRSFSDRKTEAMAYLYNNQKLKTTVENQFEKDQMLKKLGKSRSLIPLLVMVNRQVKKWNKTVFDKSTSKKKLEEETKRVMAPKEETKKNNKNEKIHEVDEHLEEEKRNSANLSGPLRGQTMLIAEGKKQIDDKIRREKEAEKEANRALMSKSQLIKSLVKEKCNIVWKIMILLTIYCTNQIMLIFKFNKLNDIFEELKTGETRVYTEMELRLYNDYKANEKLRDEKELELIEDIDPDEIHKEAQKLMSPMRLLLSAYILLLNIILSNTEFF